MKVLVIDGDRVMADVVAYALQRAGFEVFRPPTFRQYAPDPSNVRDVHSIYFEVMGEHGFVGFGLFMLLGLLAWIRAQQIIKRCKKDPDRKWAADLASMIQVSLIGYAAGGAFLGMAYFDLPYHLMIIVVLTARFSGVLNNDSPQAENASAPRSRMHGGSRFERFQCLAARDPRLGGRIGFRFRQPGLPLSYNWSSRVRGPARRHRDRPRRNLSRMGEAASWRPG